MNKHFYSWNRIDNLVHKIAIDMYKAEYIPDYIVGIIRGGAIPGITLSHIMDKPFIPLDIRLRDNNTGTSLAQNFQNFFQTATKWNKHTKVLFVDDINDTSETINWITNSIEIQKHNLKFRYKFAVVCERTAAEVSSDFLGEELTEQLLDDPDAWVVFPWENQYEN
jgi:hypoxanthine phosphoribosyltransferase